MLTLQQSTEDNKNITNKITFKQQEWWQYKLLICAFFLLLMIIIWRRRQMKRKAAVWNRFDNELVLQIQSSFFST